MRTLVIGAGRMGRRHVQIVQQLGLELIGVCDQSRVALQQAASELNLTEPLLFTAAQRAIQLAPECVIVATTAPAHVEGVCAAVEGGARLILCEKPLAVSLRECDQMIEVCNRSGTTLAVNHQMRFMEQYQAPKQRISSPAFGGLSSICVAAGNFGLAMNGTHYFEMFRFMADEQADSVTAWYSSETVPNPRGPQFEDQAGSVRLTTRSGKRFYLDCSTDHGHGLQVIYTCRLGQVRVDELKGEMTWACRQEHDRGLPTTRYATEGQAGQQGIRPADSLTPTMAVLQALIRRQDYPSGEQGRQAVAALVAAALSNADGHRTVAVAEAEAWADRRFPWA